jgi:hypothetical protein
LAVRLLLETAGGLLRALSVPKDQCYSGRRSPGHEQCWLSSIVTGSSGVELQALCYDSGIVKHCEWSCNQSVPATSAPFGNGKQGAFMNNDSKGSLTLLRLSVMARPTLTLMDAR